MISRAAQTEDTRCGHLSRATGRQCPCEGVFQTAAGSFLCATHAEHFKIRFGGRITPITPTPSHRPLNHHVRPNT